MAHQEYRLTIGVSTTTTPYIHDFLIDPIQSFQKLYPQIEVRMTEINAYTAEELLEQQTIDMALSSGFLSVSHALDYKLLKTTTVEICVNRSSPLAKEPVLSYEQLASEPIVTSFLMNQEFEKYLERGFARAGCDIGFVRRDFVKPEDPDLVCIPLKTPIFSYVTLKWRKEGVLQEVVNQLAAMIPSEEK